MDRRTLRNAPQRLATERLELCWPEARHASAVREAVNASLPILQFVRWGQQAFSDDDARRFCEADATMVAAGDCLIYFAFDRETGRFVGNLDLHSFDFAVPRCQIGYVGDVRMAGRGLMREAALVLMQLAFDLGCERVEAWCDARNQRSQRFALALGMQREGTLRCSDRDPQGALCDQVVLSRLRGNTPAAAQRPITPI